LNILEFSVEDHVKKKLSMIFLGKISKSCIIYIFLFF